MSDRRLAVALTREALEMVASPEQLHRHVSALLPDLSGRSSSIRADTGTVFRVDLPTDRFGTWGMVTLRLRGPALPDNLEVVQAPDQLCDGDQIVAQVAAERRRTTPQGVKTTPVPDHEATEWATNLLARHGLTATNLQIGTGRPFGARGSVRFTVREITAAIRIEHPSRAHDAYTNGVGRGRAYGLGMLVVLPRP